MVARDGGGCGGDPGVGGRPWASRGQAWQVLASGGEAGRVLTSAVRAVEVEFYGKLSVQATGSGKSKDKGKAGGGGSGADVGPVAWQSRASYVELASRRTRARTGVAGVAGGV